jgi:hypothetical protein
VILPDAARIVIGSNFRDFFPDGLPDFRADDIATVAFSSPESTFAWVSSSSLSNFNALLTVPSLTQSSAASCF